ncbi:hypothetical protein IW262DRAFT_1476437 [Armillaria fumosa]|nr:hypothetical protein IW262DRAFT_1476437 [Armillaria fumosa]
MTVAENRSKMIVAASSRSFGDHGVPSLVRPSAFNRKAIRAVPPRLRVSSKSYQRKLEKRPSLIIHHMNGACKREKVSRKGIMKYTVLNHAYMSVPEIVLRPEFVCGGISHVVTSDFTVSADGVYPFLLYATGSNHATVGFHPSLADMFVISVWDGTPFITDAKDSWEDGMDRIRSNTLYYYDFTSRSLRGPALEWEHSGRYEPYSPGEAELTGPEGTKAAIEYVGSQSEDRVLCMQRNWHMQYLMSTNYGFDLPTHSETWEMRG